MRLHLQAWINFNHKGVWKSQVQLRFLTFSFSCHMIPSTMPDTSPPSCTSQCSLLSLYITQFQAVGYGNTAGFKVLGSCRKGTPPMAGVFQRPVSLHKLRDSPIGWMPQSQSCVRPEAVNRALKGEYSHRRWERKERQILVPLWNYKRPHFWQLSNTQKMCPH